MLKQSPTDRCCCLYEYDVGTSSTLMRCTTAAAVWHYSFVAVVAVREN